MLKWLLTFFFLFYQTNLLASNSIIETFTGKQESKLIPRSDHPKNTTFEFDAPDIILVNQKNQDVGMRELFELDRELVFAFFFTQCVTVCSTTTLSLKSIQPHLAPDTLIAMISIDPETDTAALLQDYADKYHINEKNWLLLTGQNDQIIKFQKSFEAYRGNKMNHNTSLFIKRSGSNLITEVKNNFYNIPALLK